MSPISKAQFLVGTSKLRAGRYCMFVFTHSIMPVAPVVQLLTSKPSDVVPGVRISVQSHELGFSLTKKKTQKNK